MLERYLRESAKVQGFKVLTSKTGQTLMWFWLLFGLLLFIPNPIQRRLRAARKSPESHRLAESPSLPGLPIAPKAQQPEEVQAQANVAHLNQGQAIEDPAHSLDHFYQRLALTEAKKPGVIARVLHYGDSLIDLDHITRTMRRKLQMRFGDGGHGFVLAAKPWPWYNHIGINHAESSGWEHIRLVDRKPKDHFFGLGGAAIESQRGRAWVLLHMAEDLKASKLEVLYQRGPGYGKITVEADGKPLGHIDTAASQRSSDLQRFAMQDGSHRIRLVAQGRVRIFGVVLERNGPGVTWENIALISVRFHQLTKINAQQFKEQLRLRSPDLVVFQFGANDTINYGGNIERYGQKISSVLKHLHQSLPKASCLVIGPLDRLQRDDKGALRSPKVVRLVESKQRETAVASKCAFWDGQMAMGGPGGMKKWVKDRLVKKDMVHFNLQGSKQFAKILETALLDGYKRFKQSGSQ